MTRRDGRQRCRDLNGGASPELLAEIGALIAAAAVAVAVNLPVAAATPIAAVGGTGCILVLAMRKGPHDVAYDLAHAVTAIAFGLAAGAAAVGRFYPWEMTVTVCTATAATMFAAAWTTSRTNARRRANRRERREDNPNHEGRRR